MDVERSDNTPGLYLKLDYTRPVEVASLAKSFEALADEYRYYVERVDSTGMATAERLYITGIRSGSIEAWFQALSPAIPLLLPFMEHANTIVDFTGYLKTSIDYLLGKSRASPPALSRKNYENISAFVDPVARDAGAQMNVHTVLGDVISNNIHIHLNSNRANAVQNRARREIDIAREPVTGVHEQVVLYLYQARNDPASTAGNQAKIETIWPGAVKLRFGSDTVKSQMLGGTENPFNCAFVVDVEVGTVHGRPITYKVLAVHDRIELPGENTDAA